MKTEFERTLSDDALKKMFQFAFILVADDLQAAQIVIDAYLATSQKADNKSRDQLHKSMLKNIYLLGKKRAPQLSSMLSRPEKNNQAFYSLAPLSRAALFLWAHLDRNHQEIQDILLIPGHELTAILTNGKELLLKNTGETFDWGLS